MKVSPVYRFALAALLFTSYPTLNPAHAQGAFTYLDDEAEAGGFDVTATVEKLPAELMLAQQENNDGYVVRMYGDGVELATFTGGKRKVLAQVRSNVVPGPIVVQRRGARINVIAGNRIVLQAEDAAWQEGKIGFRGGLASLRVQGVEPIAFDDDFERVAADVAMAQAKDNPKLGVVIKDVKTTETLWTPLAGLWSTTGLSENAAAQVAQSANPFAFKSGQVGTNLAVAGRAFWNDYEYSASVKPQGSTAVGLAAYVQDANNYLLFHWGEKGLLQLRGVSAGADGKPVVRVLDESKAEPYGGGFEQKQWYRLRFVVGGGVLRAYIDDAEVLRARTGAFGRGQVAVYCENPDAKGFATFDDVSVRSTNDVYDDFTAPIPGRWQTRAGDWTLTGGAMPKGPQGAFAVVGEDDWQNYTTSADFKVPADGSGGLVLYHQAGKGTYALRVIGSRVKALPAGTVQIFRIWNGKTDVLAEAKVGKNYDNRLAHWSFSNTDGYLKASVEVNGDMRTVLDAFDETITAGRAGLYGQRGSQESPLTVDFAVEFPRTHATWAKVPDLYEDNRQAETMGGWSTPEGLWVPANPLDSVQPKAAVPVATAASSTMPGGTPVASNRILWHKGAFWGDDSIRFKLPKLTAGQTATLVLGDARRTGSLALTMMQEGDQLKVALSSADLSGAALKTGTAPANQQGQMKVEGELDKMQVEVLRRGSFLLIRAGVDEMKTLVAARVYG